MFLAGGRQRVLLLLQLLLVVSAQPGHPRATVSAGNSSSPDASGACPLTAAHSVVYSRATGVGGASVVWIQDLLWWLKGANPSLEYIGLVEAQIQACDLASFPNLRLYINPGGNAVRNEPELLVDDCTILWTTHYIPP